MQVLPTQQGIIHISTTACCLNVTPYRGPGIWLMKWQVVYSLELAMIGCCETFQETNLLLNCRLSTFAAFSKTIQHARCLTKAFAQLLTFQLSSDTKKTSAKCDCKGNNAFKCCIFVQYMFLIFFTKKKHQLASNFESCSNLNVFTTSTQLVDGGLQGVNTRMAEEGEVNTTVDGWNPTNQLRLVVYPIVYEGFVHPRWLFGISSTNSSTTTPTTAATTTTTTSTPATCHHNLSPACKTAIIPFPYKLDNMKKINIHLLNNYDRSWWKAY